MNPYDPSAILRDLPETERSFFVAQYRKLWLGALDPEGFEEVWRFLTTWRLHADRYGPPPGEILLPPALSERALGARLRRRRLGGHHRARLRARVARDRRAAAWISSPPPEG
ncbi:hypothetical protein [Actinocorallia longicatena]|uniref:Uncharacterized protein n=1 Tax=Actinocorallia longicatena TaxID=111803 RepID=A0ABP6PYP5_9ACTN